MRSLLASVRRRTRVPLVAAGGVGGPADVTDLLARGATLVQAGTAFLRCPESGAHPRYKDSLGDPDGVAITTDGSPAPSAAGVPVPSPTSWSATTMTRRRPTPRSTTPRGRSAPRRRSSGDAGHMSLYAGKGFHATPAARRPSGGVAGVGVRP